MLNIGIIGMGKMGAVHAGLINEIEGLKLIAVCEKNKDRINQIKKDYEVKVYDNANDLMNIKEIDYVVITTTNETHEEITLKAMEKGKGVIVEKPMSMNYKSTLRMIEASKKYGKNLFVHHSRRWDRDYLLVKKTLDSNILGDILLVQAKVMLCDKGWPAWGIEGLKNPWRIKKEYGGGLLLDWGAHLIDQILQLIGRDPIGIYGLLQNKVWSKEVEDYFFSILKFDNDLICQIEASNNARISLPRWFIIGTKGTLTVKGRSIPIWDEAEIRYQNDDGNRECYTIKLEDVQELTKGFYDDMVLFLKGKKKDFVSMYDASKVIKLTDLIRESSDTGKFISF